MAGRISHRTRAGRRLAATEGLHLTMPLLRALEKIANAGIGHPATARKRARLLRWGLIRKVPNTSGYELTAAGARTINNSSTGSPYFAGLGELARDRQKIVGAWRKSYAKPGRSFKIDVNFRRDAGYYWAHACIPKGNLTITLGNMKRISPRCGSSRATTPTKALRQALAQLTKATR